MTTLRQDYDENGYCIARNAIDAELASEMVEHVHWLCDKHPGVRPERLGHGIGTTRIPRSGSLKKS